MLFKSIVSAALAASVFAQPLQHQHHQHQKKDVVTHTVVVTVGAGAGAQATTVPQVVSQAASSASTDSPVSPVARSTDSSESLSSFSAPAKGITYSPYNADGSCKSSSDVAKEIKALSSYEVIRLYGVDCNQVENVLPAMAPSQKLFAGIYFMNDISGGVATLAAAVKANGGWDRVTTVSIGNELVNGGQATPAQVKGYVAEGRSALTAAGYSGPVVSVDTFIAVINNPDLCDCSDYMAVNAHAFFDGYVAAQNAGDWVLLQIERVATACPSKKVFITETGWPTRGDSNNIAVPSPENQSAALDSISKKCGNDVTFFNAYNDLWKADGAYNAEKYWGIYQ